MNYARHCWNKWTWKTGWINVGQFIDWVRGNWTVETEETNNDRKNGAALLTAVEIETQLNKCGQVLGSDLEDDSDSVSSSPRGSASPEQARWGQRAKPAFIFRLFIEKSCDVCRCMDCRIMRMNETVPNTKGQYASIDDYGTVRLWAALWSTQWNNVRELRVRFPGFYLKCFNRWKDSTVLGPWKAFQYKDIIKLSVSLAGKNDG